MKKIIIILFVLIFGCKNVDDTENPDGNDTENPDGNDDADETLENYKDDASNYTEMEENCKDTKEGINKANCLIDNAYYLDKFEKQQIREMNKVRMHPQKYLEENVLVYEQKQKDQYNNPAITNGAELLAKLQPYIDSLKKLLKNAKRVEPLYPCLGLTITVRDFIQDPGRNIHDSTSKGMKFGERLNLYGKAAGGAENAWVNMGATDLYYKALNSEDYIMGWLVDYGNEPKLGHRVTVLNPDYKYVGLAGGENNKKSHFYANFTASYQDNEEIKADINYKNPVITWKVDHNPYIYLLD